MSPGYDDIYSPENIKQFESYSNLLYRLINHVQKYLELRNSHDDPSVSDSIASLLFRSSIVRADGIMQLMSTGSSEQAVIIVRSLLESTFGLAYYCKYINKLPHLDQAYRYMFFQTQRKLCLEAIDGEALKDALTDSQKTKYKAMLSETENRLSQDDLLEARESYAKTKRAQSWYNLFDGPRDIRELSRSVGMGFVYIMYRVHCGTVHSTDALAMVSETSSGSAITRPMRWAENLPYTCRVSCTALAESTKRFLSKYHPVEAVGFNDWYIHDFPMKALADFPESIRIEIE